MQDAAALQGLNVCALMHKNDNALLELIWTHFDVGTSLMLFVTNIKNAFFNAKNLGEMQHHAFFLFSISFFVSASNGWLDLFRQKKWYENIWGEILQNICCLFIIWILISKKMPNLFYHFLSYWPGRPCHSQLR